MKKNIIYWGICIAFFKAYFDILRFIWNSFVPLSTMTDVIAFFILVCLNIPLSLISTEKVIETIKRK